MSESVRRVVADLSARFTRLVRWAFGPVEEEPAANVVPLPGPAHGPVPAIDLRLGEQRRKAS